MREGLYQPLHLLLLLLPVVGVAGTYFWVLMLVKSFPRGAVPELRRYHWFAVIASTWAFGAIVYWLWSRRLSGGRPE
jgi:hypothetical protein